MAGSGDEVNYTIRTRKSIERKMMLEVYRKLIFFDDFPNYQYVGMGSKYFVDFNLLHKELGIDDMVSIEADVENLERFKFNIPYNCIKFMSGKSKEVLPGLELSKRAIIWLDYDGVFDNSMLEDINTIMSKIKSGSIVVISANSSFYKSGDVKKICIENEKCDKFITKGTRIEWCKNEFGDRFPSFDYETKEETKEKHVTPVTATKIIRKMCLNEIENILGIRNGQLSEQEHLKFSQLFNFYYKDSAPMFTFGGIIYNESEEDKYDKCKFQDFDFVKSNEELFKIDIPFLTLKEVDLLNKLLHETDEKIIEELKKHSINENDLKLYKKVYRYFPHFTEVNIG